MNKKPIGVFDTGIGGLSILNEIQELLPFESVVYLADKKNFPYGQKSLNQIKIYSEKAIDHLLKKNTKLIVIACNTVTVNFISFLREKFPLVSFVGVEPAVKPGSKLSKKGMVVLTSPKATKSKQLFTLIRKYAKEVRVFNQGSLDLVHAVEGEWNSKKLSTVIKKALPKKVLEKVDVVILGCTHFSLVKDKIQKYVGKNIQVIDSGKAVARRVREILIEEDKLEKRNKGYYRFFTTGEPEIIRGIKFQSLQ